VSLFAGASDVLDIGCGRGEFLLLLKEAGVPGRGIDANAEMVAACRERDLHVEQADAVGYLRGLNEESLGGLFAAQVVEHLEPRDLAALLREAARVLRPGARIVLETINPTCWVAFFESYIRDLTHAKPLHPETLKFLVVASGFSDVEVRFRSPIPEDGRLRRLPTVATPPPSASREAQLLAQLVDAFNLNMERLNDRMFTHLDYAVIGTRA
jgi:O-antigen chain-terminating methyltransferase